MKKKNIYYVGLNLWSWSYKVVIKEGNNKMYSLAYFDALQDLESMKKCQYGLCYDWKHHFQPLGHDGAVNIF